MINDVTGIMLIPGDCGKNCPGSWEFAGLHCCCDECDYMLCCMENHNIKECMTCDDKACPHAEANRQ